MIDVTKRDHAIGVADGKVCPNEVKYYVEGKSQDWGNIKEQHLRNGVFESEVKSPIEYNKLKNELEMEAHIGHGDYNLLIENGLSFKDVEKFGGKAINDLVNDGSLKEILSTWGIGQEGTNQLLDHTIGKEIGRISKIAERAGVHPSELTGIFSENVAEKIQAIKRFDELTDQIIKKSPLKNLNLEGGRKEAYYLPSIGNSEKGVIIIKNDGKKVL